MGVGATIARPSGRYAWRALRGHRHSRLGGGVGGSDNALTAARAAHRHAVLSAAGSRSSSSDGGGGGVSSASTTAVAAAAAAMSADRSVPSRPRWQRHYTSTSSKPQPAETRNGATETPPPPAPAASEHPAENLPPSPPEEVYFPGTPVKAPYTPRLRFEDAQAYAPVPAYRVINERGERVGAPVEDADANATPSREALERMYRTMVKLNVMDSILYSAQRQGRISFYMTSFCEEAAVVGAAAALRDDDEVFAQYREQGLLMWRGFTYDDFCLQCCSAAEEPSRGHQMPVHYGSRRLHFHTISSTLATQIPHAVGAAYALKMDAAKQQAVAAAADDGHDHRRRRIAACFFGEGAASEGDFHAALNFAATLECPTVFLCRNNAYAISTPASEQFRGDGIVRRALGYGMDALRVDGNDALAVYGAVRAAGERAVSSSGNRPVLVELLTYRGGHHSTSDDSSRYRAAEEIAYYMEEANPVTRLRRYLGVSEADEKAMRQSERKAVLRALADAEGRPKEAPLDMFRDVYRELPTHLVRQREQLARFLDAQRGAA